MMIKWMDRKEIRMLSTIYAGHMLKKTIRNKQIEKPDCVLDYNEKREE